MKSKYMHVDMKNDARVKNILSLAWFWNTFFLLLHHLTCVRLYHEYTYIHTCIHTDSTYLHTYLQGNRRTKALFHISSAIMAALFSAVVVCMYIRRLDARYKVCRYVHCISLKVLVVVAKKKGNRSRVYVVEVPRLFLWRREHAH